MVEAAGIILAGGKSSRFYGNKAVAELASERLVDRVLSLLRPVFPKLYLVTNDPGEYAGLQAEVISDLIPGMGPLSGIHAGLMTSVAEINLVTACDMPFINQELAAFLIRETRSDDDVVVPMLQGLPEPLFAVYRKSCIPYIEQALLAGNLKVTGFYNQVQVKYLPEAKVVQFGGERVFFNVNTRDDLRRAMQYVAEPELNKA